jgi:hypothetical protein
MFNGESQTMWAWLSTIVLLLPSLILSLRTTFISLKVVCSIAFISQFITVPVFFFARDEFSWGHIKPFTFTVLEVWQILSVIGISLLIIILFFHTLTHFRLFAIPNSNPERGRGIPKKNIILNNITSPSKHPWLFVLLILLVIITVVPVNNWMFSRGIGLTGVESFRLPYKLSGILHYCTAFIIPLLLGFLYFKTHHTLFPAILLLGYGLILGLSSISRSQLIMVCLPVLMLASLERKKILLIFSSLFVIEAFSIVTLVRDVVYVMVGNRINANTGPILEILAKILDRPEFMDFSLLFNNLVSIFNRIEGFENLVMAHYYDPNAVMSPWGFVVQIIWQPLAPFDIDLHHIQWQGNVLPEGFVNCGSLLSTILIASNDNLLWIIIFGFLIAVILLLLEKSVKRIAYKYNFPNEISAFIIAFLTIIFFTASGSVSFVYPFFAVIFASVLPRIRFKSIIPLKIL